MAADQAMDILDHQLTPDESMDIERPLPMIIDDDGVALALVQSADGSSTWLVQLRSGQHNLEEEGEAADQFMDDRASGDDDGEGEDDDDGEEDDDDDDDEQWPDDDNDVAAQFDPEGYNLLETVVLLNLLAQQQEVAFETVLQHFVFGEGAYGDGGDGLQGAFVVVPASDAAVAGLEKQAFHAPAACDSEITGCAICLEDFDDGEEVTVMPCSRGHEFHPDCITKWLGQNHTCPLCRHALPTDVDDVACNSLINSL